MRAANGRPNEVTGANVGGASCLPIGTSLAARIAQFLRSAFHPTLTRIRVGPSVSRQAR